MTLQLELFTAGICSRCEGAEVLLRDILAELDNYQIALECVDVVENIDHAVSTGVLATPALAVNGRLVFCPLPGREQVLHYLKRELSK